MSFHFASSQYSRAFLDLPKPDVDFLRNSTVAFVESFDPQQWYSDPVTSLVKGEQLEGSDNSKIETKDALGKTNGAQYYATPEQVAVLKEHICSFQTSSKDLREPLRRIEHKLLTEYSGFLIGNQCIDFQKQDGITEMEEATMANTVERRLNDLLLMEEEKGIVTVNRKPIYVSCVSNFTNFLDLFRKTLRSLEVGIPCVILGRSNTVQHSYRWSKLLMDLLKEEGVDPGMITYLSCSLDDIKEITKSCKDSTGNLYTTCSRELAMDIMSGYPNTVASTGGPNTLVTTAWTEPVMDAIQMSATIESSGQCTALRHCVAPTSVTSENVEELFTRVKEIPDAPHAVQNSLFDGVFAKHQGTSAPQSDYVQHKSVDAYYKVDNSLPKSDINEFWRKVVVDFSTMDVTDPTKVDMLAGWLNENQPISLAVNSDRTKSFELGLNLFEKTGLVVYTVGSTDTAENPPALTCQARPQEAEVFGEFPPRKSLREFTKYPVVVPSSNPSYDTWFNLDYLTSQTVDDYFPTSTKELLGAITDPAVRGYCVVLIRYLQDATARNPKVGFGTSRTALWGLQRPPADGTMTWIRCGSNASSWDAVAPIYMLFFVTNARDMMKISIDPSKKDLIALLEKQGMPFSLDTDEAFSKRSDIHNLVEVSETMTSFPMLAQFVSLFFPLGHIKSTMPNDDEFLLRFKELPKKWLTTLF